MAYQDYNKSIPANATQVDIQKYQTVRDWNDEELVQLHVSMWASLVMRGKRSERERDHMQFRAGLLLGQMKAQCKDPNVFIGILERELERAIRNGIPWGSVVPGFD